MLESFDTVRAHLLALATHIGGAQQMAILGEGNISGTLDAGRFLVKASGTQLGALKPDHLVEVEAAPLLEAMQHGTTLDDAAMKRLLLDARTDADALKPSVESLFHAWLLQLPGVRYIGHTHPVAVNQILCSPRAEDFATKRLIPDQVVYCGAASVLVPYVDPGLTLAREIAQRVEVFQAQTGRVPKTILLQNHGLIALGQKHTEAAAALDMAEKAARIFVGAAALGGPVFMDDHHVHRIDRRPDEHYRQRMLRET